MKFTQTQLLAVLALSSSTAEAFQQPFNAAASRQSRPLSPITSTSYNTLATPLFAKGDHLPQVEGDDNEERDAPTRRNRRISRFLRKPLAVVAFSAAAFCWLPRPAEASAPVMAIPKAEDRDPGRDAVENYQKKMQQEAQEEIRRFNAQARKIEAEQGSAARIQFEQDYKAQQEELAKERLANIEQVKRDLLDQGICPFTDIEGQRQVFLAEKGVDLGAVAGTPMYLEQELVRRGSPKAFANKHAVNRQMIKCIVQDLKNRGNEDPLAYFERSQTKTNEILNLPAAQATALVAKYQVNLEEFGQIVPPKEGEMSAKEKMAKGGGNKQAKATAKAKAQEAKVAAKAKAKEEKARIKAEKAAAKEAAKKEKEAAKAAAVVAAASVATPDIEPTETEDESNPEPVVAEAVVAESKSSASKGIPIIPLTAGIVAVGGGGYAFKLMRDRAEADEEERQRQLQLLMGGIGGNGASSASAPALEVVDTELDGFEFDEEAHREAEDTPVVQKPLKVKKKRGFFGKKKNERETDLGNLVTTGAQAPDFAATLAKILTFGAPGRFPGVVSLPGGMPMDKFDLDEASTILSAAQENAGLSKEEAAEVFANVVNCMLIDIVDLASASLKEKDNKVTVEAIGIVIDFMNHAASLYSSIADGVVITPVTYGGDLGKGKLEQMYAAYSVSGMTDMANLDDDFDNRVGLLQDVFQINEKKAEGLAMKALQKNMMEMLKTGEGMDQMQEMMKGMGMDMEGLAGGLPGAEGDASPEELKEMLTMLKELKDSGSIPPEELEVVKKQFQDSFGSSFADAIKDADQVEGEMAPDEKELLDLMKAILDE